MFFLGAERVMAYQRTLEELGGKSARIKIGFKLPSKRFQCSICGVMVGKSDSVCGHCGADLR